MAVLALLVAFAWPSAAETVVPDLWIPTDPSFPRAGVLDMAFGPEDTLWVVSGTPIESTVEIRTFIDENGQGLYAHLLVTRSQDNGLHVWNRSQWSAIPIDAVTAAVGAANPTLTSLAIVGDTLWLGTSHGLVEASITGASDAFAITPVRVLDHEDGLAGKYVSVLEYDPLSRTLWVGHRESRSVTCKKENAQGCLLVEEPGGVTRLRAPAWQPVAYPALRDANEEWVGVAGRHVRDVAFESGTAFWTATEEGLSHFDGVRWTYHTLLDGLPSDDVQSVSVSPDGGVWAGTPLGAAWRAGTVWYTFTARNSGLADDSVADTAVDADGKTWFATAGGVSTFDAGRVQWRGHTAEVRGAARDLLPDLEDGIWAAYIEDGTGEARISRFVSDTNVYLVQPADGGIVSGTQVVFSWTGGVGAEFYEVSLSDFRSTVKVPVTRSPLARTLPPGSYNWTARAVYRDDLVGATAAKNLFEVVLDLEDEREFYIVHEDPLLSELEDRGTLPVSVPGEADPEWADWDGDGVEDLLVGTSEGKVRFYRNTGTVGAPAFDEGFVYLEAGGETIHYDQPAAIDVVDWDGDGLLDVLVAARRFLFDAYRGEVHLFRNSGSSTAPRLDPHVAVNHWFPETINTLYWSAPAVCDWNNDGHTDLMVGNGDGGVYVYFDTTSHPEPEPDDVVELLLSPWPGLDAAPYVVDWDRDGVRDLLVGNDAGYIYFYRNLGSNEEPLLDTGRRLLSGGQPIRVGGFDVFGFIGEAVPVVHDWDRDGRPDLIVGDGLGAVRWYRNVGAPNAEPLFSGYQPLKAGGLPIAAIDLAAPCVVDWDEDGDTDLLVGEGDGVITFYENINDATQQANGDAPRLVDAGFLEANGMVLAPDYRAKPVVFDWNGDGRHDLLVGADDGTLFLFANQSTGPGQPILGTPTRAEMIFANIDPGLNVSPEAADLDGDGDIDLLAGTPTGKVLSYARVPTSATPWLELATFVQADRQPPNQAQKADLTVGSQAFPYLVDWDNDGDRDLVVGTGQGSLLFFENKADDFAPDWKYGVAVTDKSLVELDVGDRARPQLVFWDADEVLDLLIGAADGSLHRFQQDNTWRYATRIHAPFGAGDTVTPGLPQFLFKGTSGVAHDFSGASPEGSTPSERFIEGVAASWLDGSISVEFASQEPPIAGLDVSDVPWRIDLTSENGGFIVGDPRIVPGGDGRFWLYNIDEGGNLSGREFIAEWGGRYSRLVDVAGLPYSVTRSTARFAVLAELDPPGSGMEVLVYERVFLSSRAKLATTVPVDGNALALAGYQAANLYALGAPSQGFAVLTTTHLLVYENDELTFRRYALDAPAAIYAQLEEATALQPLDVAVDAEHFAYVMFRLGERPIDRGRVVFSFRELGQGYEWRLADRPGVDPIGRPRPVNISAVAGDMRPEDLPKRPGYEPTPIPVPPGYEVARPVLADASFRVLAEGGFSVEGETTAVQPGWVRIADFLRLNLDGTPDTYLRWTAGGNTMVGSAEVHLYYEQIQLAVNPTDASFEIDIPLFRGPFVLDLLNGQFTFDPSVVSLLETNPLGPCAIDGLAILGMLEGQFRDASRSGVAVHGNTLDPMGGIGRIEFPNLILADFDQEFYATFGRVLPGLPPPSFDDRITFQNPTVPIAISGLVDNFGPQAPPELSYMRGRTDVLKGGVPQYNVTLGGLVLTPEPDGRTTFARTVTNFMGAFRLSMPSQENIADLGYFGEIVDGTQGPGLYSSSTTVFVDAPVKYAFDLDRMFANEDEFVFDDKAGFFPLAGMRATLRDLSIGPPFDRTGHLLSENVYPETAGSAEQGQFETHFTDVRFHFDRLATIGGGESVIWDAGRTRERMRLDLVGGGTIEAGWIRLGEVALTTPAVPGFALERPATSSTFPGATLERFFYTLDPTEDFDFYSILGGMLRSTLTVQGLHSPGALVETSHATFTMNSFQFAPEEMSFESGRVVSFGSGFNLPGNILELEPGSVPPAWKTLPMISDAVPFSVADPSAYGEFSAAQGNASLFPQLIPPAVDYFGGLFMDRPSPEEAIFSFIGDQCFRYEAKIEAKLGPISSLEVSLCFKDGRLDEVSVTATLANPQCKAIKPPAKCEWPPIPPGYPIRDGVAYLHQIGGGYSFGEQRVYVSITGYGGLPIFKIPGAGEVFLVTVEGEASFSFRGYFELKTTAKMFGHFPIGGVLFQAGKVHLDGNYQGDGVYISGWSDLLGGLIRGSATAWIYGYRPPELRDEGHFGVILEAELRVPDWVPIVGGWSFGSARISFDGKTFRARVTIKLLFIRFSIGIEIGPGGFRITKPGLPPGQYAFQEGYHSAQGVSVLTNFRKLPLLPPSNIKSGGPARLDAQGDGCNLIAPGVRQESAMVPDDATADTLIVRYEYTNTTIDDVTLTLELPTGETFSSLDTPLFESYPETELVEGATPVFFFRQVTIDPDPNKSLKEVGFMVKGPIALQDVPVDEVDPVTGQVTGKGTGQELLPTKVIPGLYTLTVETSGDDPCGGFVDFLYENRSPSVEPVKFEELGEGVYVVQWEAYDPDLDDDPIVRVHLSPDFDMPERSFIVGATEGYAWAGGVGTSSQTIDLHLYKEQTVSKPLHVFLSVTDGRENPTFVYVETVEPVKFEKCPPQVEDVVVIQRRYGTLVCWTPVDWIPPAGVRFAGYSILATDVTPDVPTDDQPFETMVPPDRVTTFLRNLRPGRTYSIVVNAIAVEGDVEGVEGEEETVRITCGGEPSPPVIVEEPEDEETNGAPYFASRPIRQVTVKEPYEYEVVVLDPDDDFIALTLEQFDYPEFEDVDPIPVPSGSPTPTPRPTYEPMAPMPSQETLPLQIATLQTGAVNRFLLSMPPTATDDDSDRYIGYYVLSLTATDPDGATAVQEFTLSIERGEPELRAVISSQPNAIAVAGQSYRYPVTVVTEPEDAEVRYRLVAGPPDACTDDFGIDPLSGMISWDACAGAIGRHEVVLKVHAPVAGCPYCIGRELDSQSYVLTVIRDPLEKFRKPTADAGEIREVPERSRVQLDGSRSTMPLDAPGPLAFRWTQTGGPEVLLEQPTGMQPRFTAPDVLFDVETLVFQLIVNDGREESEPDTVEIRVRDIDPTATPTSTASPTPTFTATPYIERPRLLLVRGGNLHLAEIDGGGMVALTDYDGVPDGVAGNGSLANAVVAYVRQGQVWVLDIYDEEGQFALPGTTDRPIPTTGDVTDPYVSLLPSGGRVAYVSGTVQQALTTVELDGIDPRAVANDDAALRWLSWEVASYIVYASDEGSGSGLYRVNADGKDAPVGIVAGDATRASAGGPSAAIAFVRNATELWTVEPSGANAQQVPGVVLDETSWPRWQPGQSVLFFTYQGDVWRVRTDGSNLVRVTSLGDVDSLDVGFAPPVPDTDFDGIPDLNEGNPPQAGRTNRYLADSDGDALLDGFEDADRNGSRDPGETNARRGDSDTDFYEDGIEVRVIFTDPLNPADPGGFVDSDRDALPDFGPDGRPLDPNNANPDIDADRYSDGIEAMTIGLAAVTDPEVHPRLGDVFADGFVSNLDALVLQTMFIGNVPFEAHSSTNADPNRDGFITNLDALILQAYFLNLLGRLPTGQ